MTVLCPFLPERNEFIPQKIDPGINGQGQNVSPHLGKAEDFLEQDQTGVLDAETDEEDDDKPSQFGVAVLFAFKCPELVPEETVDEPHCVTDDIRYQVIDVENVGEQGVNSQADQGVENADQGEFICLDESFLIEELFHCYSLFMVLREKRWNVPSRTAFILTVTVKKFKINCNGRANLQEPNRKTRFDNRFEDCYNRSGGLPDGVADISSRYFLVFGGFMKGKNLVCFLSVIIIIAGCVKTGSDKTAPVKIVTNKTVVAANSDPVIGYKDISWGDSMEKVKEVYGKKPDYTIEYSSQGRSPHLVIRSTDPKSPIDNIEIYFYKNQVEQLTLNYSYKNTHSEEIFNAFTKKYDDLGIKHTDERTGPIDNSYRGTKYTRKWYYKSTIILIDYFKDFQKGTFIWIGNYALMSIKILNQEIADAKINSTKTPD